MATLDEIKTFNIEDKTYAVEAISPGARELLQLFLDVEDDIRKLQKQLAKSQHALASIGSMFKDSIKEVEPLSQDEVNRRAAAEALITAGSAAKNSKNAKAKKPTVVK